MRRFHAASAIVVLLAVVLGNARGAVQYTITDLGNIGSSPSPAAISTVGGQLEIVGSDITGYTSENETGTTAWYWTASSGMVNMAPLLSGVGSAHGSAATGVNSSGQIVGVTGNATGFVYTIGGTLTTFGPPAGGDLEFIGVGGVNSSGQINATYTYGINPVSNAAICSANGGAAVSLGDGNGQTGISTGGINNNGWVVGYGTLTTDAADALVYAGGTWNDLGNLGGAAISWGNAIDSRGDVAGGASTTGWDEWPTYVPYNGSGWGAMVNLGLNANNTSGGANGINDHGQIVGSEGYGTYPNAVVSPYLWGTTAGSGIALSTLVTNLHGWTLNTATAIDDAGDIIGYGTNSGGQEDAFLLTPTPEPSTIALLLAGAACLLGCAWRRQRRP